MNKINSKEVKVSFNENCSNRTDEKKSKNEITLKKQRNSKIPYKDSSVYDIVKHSKDNSLELLNINREQKLKKDIEQGKVIYKLSCFFLMSLQN